MNFFEPDRYFSRISAIDIEKDIIRAGFTHVLLDIDNTILARDTHLIPRDVKRWLARARSAGLLFCLVSNNWHRSVYKMAERIELPIVAKAIKPLPFAFLRAMRKLGARRASTLVIGDQLMTDIVGAHLLGMRAYLVCPLVEQDLRHTLLLRRFEQVLLGDTQPEAPVSSAAAPVVSASSAAVSSTIDSAEHRSGF